MIYLCYDTALNEEYTLIKLMQRYPDYISLFNGTDDENIWDAAPYLFTVDDNFYDLRSDWLVRLDHCILFETRDALTEVCQFLQYYMYKKVGNTTQYLRIWDARVLKKLWVEWDEKERLKFFGFFETVYTEQDHMDGLDKWQIGRFNKPVPEAILKIALFPPRAIPAAENTVKPQVYSEAQTQKTEEPLVPVPVNDESNDLPKRRRFFIE